MSIDRLLDRYLNATLLEFTLALWRWESQTRFHHYKCYIEHVLVVSYRRFSQFECETVGCSDRGVDRFVTCFIWSFYYGYLLVDNDVGHSLSIVIDIDWLSVYISCNREWEVAQILTLRMQVYDLAPGVVLTPLVIVPKICPQFWLLRLECWS